MKRYKYSTLEGIVNKFSKKKIMVVGDLLLDQLIYGEVSRISPEAPVPVVWVKEEDHYRPGGSCNVASNLAKLGAEVTLVGVVGDDIYAHVLKAELEKRNISIEGLISDSKRPTIRKTRVFARHQKHQRQQVVRIDRESIDPISGKCQKKVEEFISSNLKNVDGIIIEDYGKGVVTPSLINIIKKARKYGKLVAVDPKENHFQYYKGVSVITPNQYEAVKASGFSLDTDESLKKGGERLLNKCKTDVILITLGEKGMMVFEKGKSPKKIPTLAQEVFDVSGAGDTVIAIYSLAAVSGASPVTAAHIANCAAGIVVGKIGPEVVSKSELLASLKAETGGKKK